MLRARHRSYINNRLRLSQKSVPDYSLSGVDNRPSLPRGQHAFQVLRRRFITAAEDPENTFRSIMDLMITAGLVVVVILS